MNKFFVTSKNNFIKSFPTKLITHNVCVKTIWRCVSSVEMKMLKWTWRTNAKSCSTLVMSLVCIYFASIRIHCVRTQVWSEGFFKTDKSKYNFTLDLTRKDIFLHSGKYSARNFFYVRSVIILYLVNCRLEKLRN